MPPVPGPPGVRAHVSPWLQQVPLPELHVQPLVAPVHGTFASIGVVELLPQLAKEIENNNMMISFMVCSLNHMIN